MSIIIDDVDREISIEKTLNSIDKSLKVIAMILREAYEIDITVDDIEENET